MKNFLSRTRVHLPTLLAWGYSLGLLILITVLAYFLPGRFQDNQAQIANNEQIVDNQILYNSQIFPITPQPNSQLCWDVQHVSWSDIKSASSPLAGGGGLASGMGADDFFPSAHPTGINTFTVEPETSLDANYHIWLPKGAGNPNPIEISLLMILNEKILVSAIQPANVFDLIPGDELTVTLEIPALGQGVHDLIVLGLMNPNDQPDPYGVVNSFANRFTLLVGATPQLISRTYTQLPIISSIVKGDPQISLELSLQSDSLAIWNWPDSNIKTPLNQDLDYFALAGYVPSVNTNAPNLPLPVQMPFALLAFHDQQQIAVTTDANVFYGLVTKDTAYARIPAKFPASQVAGRQDLLVLRIDYPGIPMCILRGPYDGQSYVFNYNVFVRRVAIDVIP